MGEPRLPIGPPKPKYDPGDVSTWDDTNVVLNLRWAESTTFQPGERGFRWWSVFRHELREEADRRRLRGLEKAYFGKRDE